MFGNPRHFEILDPMLWIPDSKFLIPESVSVELGFRIPIVSEIQIPWAVFQIPKPRIPDSTSKK